MNDIQLLVFTHANHKRSIVILPEQLFSFYQGADHATHLLATGGAIIPVSESVEQVKERISKLKSNTKGAINGNTNS